MAMTAIKLTTNDIDAARRYGRYGHAEKYLINIQNFNYVIFLFRRSSGICILAQNK